MDCPNCKTPVKLFDLFKINHKRPYKCPVCFKVSGFNHSKGFLNIFAGLAGVAGVIFFYSLQWYGLFYGVSLLLFLLLIFILIFIKYAKLEIVEQQDE